MVELSSPWMRGTNSGNKSLCGQWVKYSYMSLAWPWKQDSLKDSLKHNSWGAVWNLISKQSSMIITFFILKIITNRRRKHNSRGAEWILISKLCSMIITFFYSRAVESEEGMRWMSWTTHRQDNKWWCWEPSKIWLDLEKVLPKHDQRRMQNTCYVLRPQRVYLQLLFE